MSRRVLEVSFKQLEKMDREEIERDLEFLGLIIMENRLKAATTGIIRELKEADVQVVMITVQSTARLGDNIHTAVSVAKECGILATGERVVRLSADPSGQLYCHNTLHVVPVGRTVPFDREWKTISGRGMWRESGEHSSRGVEEPAREPRYKIAMTGDAWQILRSQYPAAVGRCIERGAVFARMSPDQKQQLVVEYQALGYYVGMCGDGANDCGALRAAHAGVSLSERESSVAAPFTAPDILGVTRVLREGRAALSTSFGVFKFMIAYSLTEFLSVAFLYYFDSNLTDFQFLFIDVGLIVNFPFFFGVTEAHTGKLSKLAPLTSLLGIVPIASLVGQMLFIGIAQYLSYLAISYFPWYVRHTYEGEDANKCWKNYAIYTVSMFQYISLAIAFSHGSPYRRSILTNGQLMVSIAIMTILCIYITVAPAEWLANFLELKMPKDQLMCYIVLALASFNFVIGLFYERFVIEYLMEGKRLLPKFVKESQVRKTPHLMIKRQLTEMDYLDCESALRVDKSTNSAGHSS